MLATVFDVVLFVALFWLAWRALTLPDLFTGIVCFIAFGVLMALAWLRLRAPDIALAEIAIGSGITGALLLSALARSRRVAAKHFGGQSVAGPEREKHHDPATL